MYFNDKLKTFLSVCLIVCANAAHSNPHTDLISTAETLVSDLENQHINNPGILLSAPEQRTYPNKRIYMARFKDLTIEKLKLLLDFGIPNHFQVGTSTQRLNGAHSYQQSFIDNVMLGLPKNINIPTALHPKYGVVDSKGDFSTAIPKHYGSVIIEFDLGAVQRRTTFTNYDSYGSGQPSGRAFPIKMEQHISADFEPYHSFDYIEAQIWGPVSLRDVKALYVSQEHFVEFRTIFNKMARLHGVDIYTMVPEETKDSFIPKERELKIRGSRNLEVVKDLPVVELIERFRATSDQATRAVIIDRLGFLTQDTLVSHFLSTELTVKLLEYYNLLIERNNILIASEKARANELEKQIQNANYESAEDKTTEIENLEKYLGWIEGRINIYSKESEYLETILKNHSKGFSLVSSNVAGEKLPEIGSKWRKELNLPRFLNPYKPASNSLLKIWNSKSIFESPAVKPILTKTKELNRAVDRLRTSVIWLEYALLRRTLHNEFLDFLSDKDRQENQAQKSHEPQESGTKVIQCKGLLKL